MSEERREVKSAYRYIRRIVRIFVKNFSNRYSHFFNIALRIALNYIYLGLFPTYLILIYLAHRSIFPYDLFSQGKFGIEVFFYLSFMMSIGFTFILLSPALFLWSIKNEKSVGFRIFIFGAQLKAPLLLR